ncbi:hypothetical protein LTR17_022931 [Elasticomyces elasticus]|nr:hypothetical protein LTR17_022931 [Elasticomyces elasticus]
MEETTPISSASHRLTITCFHATSGFERTYTIHACAKFKQLLPPRVKEILDRLREQGERADHIEAETVQLYFKGHEVHDEDTALSLEIRTGDRLEMTWVPMKMVTIAVNDGVRPAVSFAVKTTQIMTKLFHKFAERYDRQPAELYFVDANGNRVSGDSTPETMNITDSANLTARWDARITLFDAEGHEHSETVGSGESLFPIYSRYLTTFAASLSGRAIHFRYEDRAVQLTDTLASLHIEHDTDIEINLPGLFVPELNLRFADNHNHDVEFDMLRTSSIDKALVRYAARFYLDVGDIYGVHNGQPVGPGTTAADVSI